MRILFIGSYFEDEIVPAPAKVGREIYKRLEAGEKRFYTYFFDGSKYSRFEKLFGEESIGDGIYRLGLFKLLKYFVNYKPDIVQIVNAEFFYLILLPLKPFLKYKIVYLNHSLISYSSKYFSTFNYFLKLRFLIIERIIFKVSNILLVLSDRDKRYLNKLLNVPLRKIRIVNNGANNPGYSKKYESSNDNLKLIFIGDPSVGEKGFNFLIKSLSLVPMNITLTVCSSAYQKLYVNDNKSNLIINYLQPVPEEELFNHIIKNDIIVVPSKYDSFSLALLESMTTGIHFVATNKVGLTERFKGEFNSFIVPFGNEKKMAESITRLFNMDINEKVKLSCEIKRFSENYTWDTIVSDYQKIYADINTYAERK